MKSPLEDLIKPKKKLPPESLDKFRVSHGGHRSGTIRDIIEKVVKESGRMGITVDEIVEKTGLTRRQVTANINHNDDIMCVVYGTSYRKRRYHYEV